jgi:hypothetical protein
VSLIRSRCGHVVRVSMEFMGDVEWFPRVMACVPGVEDSFGRLGLFVSPSSCVLGWAVHFSVQQGQDTGEQSSRRSSPVKSLFIIFLASVS